MNKSFIFLCISSAILVLSIIVICISPIINNFEIKNPTLSWSFAKWRNLNCKIFEDQEKSDTLPLDDIQKMKTLKNLCRTKKGMHDLEYAALIIDLIIGIVCTNLSLFIYFNVNKNIVKNVGLIGLIVGIIGFIITFIDVGFSGYIFDNAPAFREVNYNYFKGASTSIMSGGITKLFPNGATTKVDGTNVYDNDKSYFSKYVKFKELGQKQYNYDKKTYKAYNQDDRCRSSDPSNCEYLYDRPPYINYEYKDLHDRWLTTIIFSVFIFACNAGLSIFGFLIFKNGVDTNEDKTLVIS